MSLSDMACRNAKPQGKPYRLFDTGGLYLDVMKSGNRYWRMKYRFHNKEKLLTIGSYPTLSLVKARELRDVAKEQLKNFIDPAYQKQKERRLAKYKAEQTFQIVALEWHKEKRDEWSESHANNILHRLKMDIFPQIGNIPMNSLTTPHVFDCIKKVEARGARDPSRRCLHICGQVFRFAKNMGIVEHDVTTSICSGLKKYRKGHYNSIKVNELPDLLDRLQKKSGRLFIKSILAFKLMLLTFVRTNELMEATWDEVDFENRTWTIAARRMKMRSPHIVPLSHQAVAILKELKDLARNSPFVFPSISKPKKTMNLNTILSVLEQIGLKAVMTGHGVRSLMAGIAHEKLGYNWTVIDRQLAHLPKGKVNQAYDRAEFLKERTQLMQEIADYIDQQTSLLAIQEIERVKTLPPVLITMTTPQLLGAA